MAQGILTGIRVLEDCRLVCGPFCTKLLADLGAEVVKIEEPGLGDEARRRGPFVGDVPHPEGSGLFFYLNTNKKGITLNLDSASGRKVFRALTQHVDLIVEDNPPALNVERGLDYEHLRATNRRLVLTSITPFGQSGPYKDYKAYHLNTFHGGGEGYVLPGGWGYKLFPEREPIQGPGFLGDLRAGLMAAIATLVALYHQGATGKGQHVDLSKQEALLIYSSPDLGRYPNEEFIETRATRFHIGTGIARCKDGYAHRNPTEEHHWQSLVQLMGNPDWANEERFKDRASRARYIEEVDERIGEWMREHTREEVFHGGQALGCPTAPVNSAEDLLRSEQLQARGFFLEIEYPHLGRIVYPGVPYRFSPGPQQEERSAPLLGEHNAEVYCSWLGYNRAELVRMRGAGIV